MSFASSVNEVLQEKQNEIDRLSEYEDRAERAEEALKKLSDYMELLSEPAWNKYQEILDNCKVYLTRK